MGSHVYEGIKKRRANLVGVTGDFKTCKFSKNKNDWGLTYTKEVEKDGLIWLV